jgi:uroporphyrinogen decarboxylase
MSKEMTPKERVKVTLACEQPDRVPVDYDANAGIDARLKAHFGLQPNDGEGLRQALGVDFRGVWPRYVGPRLHAELPDSNVDAEWGIRYRWTEHSFGGYWEQVDNPLKEADAEAVAAWPMPSPDDYDYSGIASACERFGGYAIHVGSPGLGDTINTAGFFFGMERVMMDMVTDEPAFAILSDRRIAVQLEIARRTIEAAHGAVDFVWMGEDLGTQIAPMISLDLFRRQIRPRMQRFVDMAKSFDLPVMVHTCGSSSWAYEDFIEMGIKVVDTLQPEAKDMSPASLKARFGGRLAFHGCISTAGPVAYGNVDDTVKYVRETLHIMMPGGGYCLSPTHSLQDNSPTENVVAMYETARKLGGYG